MNLQERMAQANDLLAPYAVPHEGRLGRAYPEAEDDMRFPFQRDRDRIINTQAFRRLQGKTQVFVAGEGDHFRTRLTHTMEVAQISRDLARMLRLNEDLAECIALAHDLGHPPFGHAGEDALDAWMGEHGLHFEHNEQSHRITTLLETHSNAYPGLNLNGEVVEALRKHDPGALSTVEAELVNVADEIAYTSHDCDDGLTGGLFAYEELLAVPLAHRADVLRRTRGTAIRGALIRLLAEDFLRVAHGETGGRPRIGLSAAMRTEIEMLRSFLSRHMYNHPSIAVRTERGKEIVLLLCRAYEAAPTEKILALRERTGSELPEAAKDYVAGMTDTYAEAQAAALRPPSQSA